MRYKDLLPSSDPTLMDFFCRFDVEHDPAEDLKNILIVLKKELEEERSIRLQMMYGDVEEDLKQIKIKAEIDQIRAKVSEIKAKTSTENNRH